MLGTGSGFQSEQMRRFEIKLGLKYRFDYDGKNYKCKFAAEEERTRLQECESERTLFDLVEVTILLISTLPQRSER